MRKSVFNLLFMILCIFIWLINPWPFSKSINHLKTDYVEKPLTVRGGFDPLQREARKSNPTRSSDNFVQPKPESGQSTAKQSSSVDSSAEKLTYKPMPDSNPGGSGNYDSDENLSNSGNSNQVISDPEFWNSVETLGESDAEEESSPTEASNPTPPTGKLTKNAIQDNDATTKMISPTEFNDWEGEGRTIKSKELKKTVFAKGYEAGVVPVENLVPCPVQTDPTKYQQDKCGLITDQSVDDMRAKLLDLTTSRKPSRVKIELPMPFYDAERAVGYMDLKTGDCAFYHEDNGKYWTYVKYDSDQVKSILKQSDSIKYAKPKDSNTEL